MTVLVQRLSEPTPRDARVTQQLGSYKGLDARWHDWREVANACQELVDGIVETLEESK